VAWCLHQQVELWFRWVLSTEAGHDGSLEEIKSLYIKGHVTKEVYTKALCAQQSANDEIICREIAQHSSLPPAHILQM
jgi:hypothetical protein